MRRLPLKGRGLFWLLLLLCGGGWLVSHFYSDLQSPAVPDEDSGTVTLEDVQARHVVGGQSWFIHLNRGVSAGQQDQELQGIEGRTTDGPARTFQAPEGRWKGDQLFLQKPSGSLGDDAGGQMTWASEKGHWDQKADLWKLTEGVSARLTQSGGQLDLKSAQARWEGKAGVITLPASSGTWRSKEFGDVVFDVGGAAWRSDENRWEFSQGVTFSGPRGKGKAEEAALTEGHQWHLKKGQLTWYVD